VREHEAEAARRARARVERERREAMAEAADALARRRCAAPVYCTGPERRPVSGRTCYACAALRRIRRALRVLDEKG
jgi:hypothetical protein